MIDFQILDTARSFRDAAHRAAETRPSSDGQPNVLIFPATHLAVLSCELYIKSMAAERDYDGDPKVDVVRVFAKANRGHEQDIDQLDGRIGEELRTALLQSEKDLLLDLREMVAASRYPYEKSASMSGRLQSALNYRQFLDLADKLERIIVALLQPDDQGRIRLD